MKLHSRWIHLGYTLGGDSKAGFQAVRLWAHRCGPGLGNYGPQPDFVKNVVWVHGQPHALMYVCGRVPRNKDCNPGIQTNRLTFSNKDPQLKSITSLRMRSNSAETSHGNSSENTAFT